MHFINKCIRNLSFLALFLTVISFPLSAKTLPDLEDFQVWAPVNINYKHDEQWRGFLELQARVGNDASLLKTAIVRLAIGYAFTPDWTVWVGYLAQFTTKSYDDNQYDVENRAWQGVTYKHQYGQFITEMRNRFEERFLANNSDPEYRWRTRFRVEYLIPNTPFSAIGSEEIFINTNNNQTNKSLQAGPDQNRAYIGAGYRFNKQVQIESGYLSQHVWGYAGKQNQNNDVWMTNLNLNF